MFQQKILNVDISEAFVISGQNIDLLLIHGNYCIMVKRDLLK